jgi:hypothetical protein
MSADNNLRMVCSDSAMPPMSPTQSEIADYQQAFSLRANVTQEDRMQALEMAVKNLER